MAKTSPLADAVVASSSTPEFHEVEESKRVDPQLEPYEVIAGRLGTPKWHMAATAAYHRWAQGKEVTEAQFVAAIETMLKGSVLGPA